MIVKQRTYNQDAIDIGITMKQAAEEACVSLATIRNWVKTKYLVPLGRGMILKSSFDDFMAHVAGKAKLNSRANKLHKGDTKPITLQTNAHVSFSEFDIDSLGSEYENSLSDSYRNKEGIYYTPMWVIEDMLNDVTIASDATFLDPCCGSGNFLIQAIRMGVNPENIYGYDTDEFAVDIAKRRIKEEFGVECPHIVVGDFLSEAQKLMVDNVAFDLIFTNPPWGKKMPKSRKVDVANCFGCGSSLDTTSLFMGASLCLLKENGVLGFLMQEAFFNISTFEDIRKRVLSKRVLRMVNYGKAFKGLLTNAQAVILKNECFQDNAIVSCEYNKTVQYRTQLSFRNTPKHIFNFWVSAEESKIIDWLYSKKYITLKDKALWGLGIVTGNNDKYCCNYKIDDNYLPIYKGADIKKTGLREVSTYILNDFSSFQQVAPIELYNAPEKLIYRFISSDLCFFYDNQQRLILNSANILIPQNIGITTRQLCDLLNSEVLNWLFGKLFKTHKVLRGDLELLPLHIGYFSEYSEFSNETFLQYLNLKQEDNGTFGIEK